MPGWNNPLSIEQSVWWKKGSVRVGRVVAQGAIAPADRAIASVVGTKLPEFVPWHNPPNRCARHGTMYS